MNTLLDQQQHTSLLYIKHCSLLFTLFLFSSTEGIFTTKQHQHNQQPKNLIVNTVHYSAVQYRKFS